MYAECRGWEKAVDSIIGKKFTLLPYETREISINEIIDDKVRDDTGQTLTTKRTSGVVNWMVPDSGEGTGRLMVTSHSQALARNFSCGQFIVVCGGYTFTSNGLMVGQIGPVISFVPDWCDEFSPSQCTGGSQVSSGSANYDWYDVGGSTVARLNTSSDEYLQSPNIYGVGSGNGHGYVYVSTGSCQMQGSGGISVQPSITSISPATINLGASNVQLTISGAGFGTSGSVNLPSGVTYNLNNILWSNSSVVISVSAAYNATVGNGNLSISANGATSNNSTLTLDGPNAMIVEGDTIGYKNGTSGNVRRVVTYQVQNFSHISAAAIPICENPQDSAWNCQQADPGTNAAWCPGIAGKTANPSTTLANGQFSDGWDMGTSTFTPSGCGSNLSDPWSWEPQSSSLHEIGLAAGYLHTNAIKIDNVTSTIAQPSKISNGTVMPK